MKRVVLFALAFVISLSLCACGTSPEERLPDEVKEYISENYRITVGGFESEPVNVDVASVVEIKDNQWAVMGTYTVKVDHEVMSAKFGMVATYDETDGEFTFSDEKFDDFE